MKTENREKEYTGLMESLESRTVRGRDRERETHRILQRTYIKPTILWPENPWDFFLQTIIYSTHIPV